MAFGQLDTRGIWQYGEDDVKENHSTLLNLGQQSVSDALKYFSGTPAKREAMIPAPEGAIWQDTIHPRTVWRGQGGAWVARPDFVARAGYTPVVTGYASGFPSSPAGIFAQAGNIVHVEAAATVARPIERITSDVTVSLPIPAAAGALAISGGGYILDSTAGVLYEVSVRMSSSTAVILEVHAVSGSTMRLVALRSLGITPANAVAWRVAFSYLAA